VNLILFVPVGSKYFFVAHCAGVGTNGTPVAGAVVSGPAVPPFNVISSVQLTPPSVEYDILSLSTAEPYVQYAWSKIKESPADAELNTGLIISKDTFVFTSLKFAFMEPYPVPYPLPLIDQYQFKL